MSTQNPTVGANVGTAADVAGQATRDTVDNLMEPYIDDTFYRLTGLNLRLTVGSDGFQGRVRKRSAGVSICRRTTCRGSRATAAGPRRSISGSRTT